MVFGWIRLLSTFGVIFFDAFLVYLLVEMGRSSSASIRLTFVVVS